MRRRNAATVGLEGIVAMAIEVLATALGSAASRQEVRSQSDSATVIRRTTRIHLFEVLVEVTTTIIRRRYSDTGIITT